MKQLYLVALSDTKNWWKRLLQPTPKQTLKTIGELALAVKQSPFSVGIIPLHASFWHREKMSENESCFELKSLLDSFFYEPIHKDYVIIFFHNVHERDLFYQFLNEGLPAEVQNVSVKTLELSFTLYSRLEYDFYFGHKEKRFHVDEN